MPASTGNGFRTSSARRCGGSTCWTSRARCLARAQAYGIRRLGSLDAIHLATADPFLPELTGLVTYDAELAAASAEIGIAVIAPR